MKLSRTKIFLGLGVAALCVFFVIKDHDAAVRKGLTFKLDQLNSQHLYGYMYDVGQEFNPVPVETQQMQRLAAYYDHLARFLPDRSEPSGLSGFAYYHSGLFEESYRAYSRAAELDPEFFWYQHNRAALLAKAGQAERSVLACRKALKADPKYTMTKILRSREIYFPLLLAKVTQHLNSCKDDGCLEPSVKLMEHFGEIRSQMSYGYRFCQEAVQARDDPQKVLDMAARWPLAGF